MTTAPKHLDIFALQEEEIDTPIYLTKCYFLNPTARYLLAFYPSFNEDDKMIHYLDIYDLKLTSKQYAGLYHVSTHFPVAESFDLVNRKNRHPSSVHMYGNNTLVMLIGTLVKHRPNTAVFSAEIDFEKKTLTKATMIGQPIVHRDDTVAASFQESEKIVILTLNGDRTVVHMIEYDVVSRCSSVPRAYDIKDHARPVHAMRYNNATFVIYLPATPRNVSMNMELEEIMVLRGENTVEYIRTGPDPQYGFPPQTHLVQTCMGDIVNYALTKFRNKLYFGFFEMNSVSCWSLDLHTLCWQKLQITFPQTCCVPMKPFLTCTPSGKAVLVGECKKYDCYNHCFEFWLSVPTLEALAFDKFQKYVVVRNKYEDASPREALIKLGIPKSCVDLLVQ